MATDPHIIPPTSGRANVPATREELDKLPDDQHDVAFEGEDFGQLVAKPSEAVPKLTFQEEKDRQAQRERDYRAAVSHKEKFTCPECEASVEGRVEYKHHLKDVHRWKKSKITEHLEGKGSAKRSKSKCVDVPLKPFTHNLPARVEKLLERNGIRPRDYRDVREVSPEILAVLKCDATSSCRVRHEIIRPPSCRKIKKIDIQPSQKEAHADFDLMFNSPGLALLVPDDDDRKCFLVHHILKKSMSETAVEVFGSAELKPRVQKIVERVRQALMVYLQKGQRNPGLRQDDRFIQLRGLLRGTQDAVSFELEVENFKVSDQKPGEHIDYHPPNPEDPPEDH